MLIIFTSFSLSFLILLLVVPVRLLIASFLALSFLTFTRSFTASYFVKSILPYKNALFVNSPGSASLIPLFSISSNTFFVVAIPP